MRMKRVLGILLALMLVAVCGCAKPEEKPVVDEKPVYTVREGFVTDLEDLVSIKYSNGETTISMEIFDGAWFQENDKETWMNQTIIANIVKIASQMAYIEEVKDAKPLADYGLENPVYTITMENEDGFVVSLYVGNTEGEDECYVTTDDKKVVYKVSNAIIGALEFDQEKLLAVEVDPMEYLKNMVDEELLEGDDGIGLEDEPLLDNTAGQNPDEGSNEEIPVEPEEEPDQNPEQDSEQSE